MSAFPPINSLLQLGRISNLPTVWSNVVAAWLIGGGGSGYTLGLIVFAASCLYTAGMFLNDFFDVEFDSKFRPERPIPAGKISRATVGLITGLLFTVGLLSLILVSLKSAVIGIVLIGVIGIYDRWHKGFWWAPIVMGMCRFLLYPLGASTGVIDSEVIAFGLALTLYVAGITYLARGESQPEKTGRWAVILLVAPLFLPLAIIPFSIWFQGWILVFQLILLVWMAWILIPFLTGKYPSIGRIVSGLLAGIVLVDALHASVVVGSSAFFLILLFIFAQGLQRAVAAT